MNPRMMIDSVGLNVKLCVQREAKSSIGGGIHFLSSRITYFLACLGNYISIKKVYLMLGPDAMHLLIFLYKESSKCHLVMCTSNKNPDLPPLPLQEKNYFAHNFDELDECSDIIPSTQTTQALGKLLIFYWWTWLSKHNKNRLSVIAHWKSRWQSSKAASGSLKFQIKSI